MAGHDFILLPCIMQKGCVIIKVEFMVYELSCLNGLEWHNYGYYAR